MHDGRNAADVISGEVVSAVAVGGELSLDAGRRDVRLGREPTRRPRVGRLGRWCLYTLSLVGGQFLELAETVLPLARVLPFVRTALVLYRRGGRWSGRPAA